jgi:hypothetical protein
VGAEALKRAHLDVVVDYDGLHDFNNIKLLSKRPATIQATWLGFAGTTGQGRRVSDSIRNNPAFDYVIADRIILAPDMPHSQSYTENFVFLPYSYQPQDEYYNFRGGGRKRRLLSRIEKHQERARLLISYGLDHINSSEASLSKAVSSIW